MPRVALNLQRFEISTSSSESCFKVAFSAGLKRAYGGKLIACFL